MEIIGRSSPPLAVDSPCGHGGGSILKKRCRSEMEAVQGLLEKAKALVRKAAAAAAHPKVRRPLPRRVKEKEAMTMAQKEQLVALLSSLSAGILPSHVVGFMRRRCSWRTVPDVDGGDELEVDLGSMEDAALFELRKMLDDEAANASAAIRRSSPCEIEDGEVADDMDICGGVSPLPAHKPHLVLSPPPAVAEQEDLTDIFGGVSPLPAHEDLLDASPLVKPEADEFVDIEGDATPVAGNPSSSSSSSSGNSSGSSCSQTSSSSSESGSGSDSSDEDDGDTASSSPKTANHLPVVVEAVAKPSEQPQVAEQAYKIEEKLLTQREAAAPAPAGRMSELIARAQAEKLRRDAERKKAREEQPR